MLTATAQEVRFDEEVLFPEARRHRRRRLFVWSGIVFVAALVASLFVTLSTMATPAMPARPPFGVTPTEPTAQPLVAAGTSTGCSGGSGVNLRGYGGESLFGAPLPGGGALIGYQLSGVGATLPRQAPVVLEELSSACAPVQRFGPGGMVTLPLPFVNGKVPPRTGVGGEAFIGAMAATPSGDVLLFGNYGREIIGAEVGPNGRLVRSFGEGGWTGFVNQSVSEFLSNVAIVAFRPDGTILVGVDDVLGGGQSLVYELDSRGRLVTSFGTHGVARVLGGGAQLAQLLEMPDGSIVAVGELQYEVNKGHLVLSSLDAAGRADDAGSRRLTDAVTWLPAANKIDGVAYVDRFGGVGVVGWGVTNPPWPVSGEPAPPVRAPAFGFEVELGPRGESEGTGTRRLVVPPPPSLETYIATGLPSGASLVSVPLADGYLAIGDNPQTRGISSILQLHLMRLSGAIASPFGAKGSSSVSLGGTFAGLAVFAGPRGDVDVVDAESASLNVREVAVSRPHSRLSSAVTKR